MPPPPTMASRTTGRAPADTDSPLGYSVDHEATGRGQGVQPIEKRQGGPMAVLAAQKRPSLASNQVGREDLLGRTEGTQHVEGVVVPSVAGSGPRHPS